INNILTMTRSCFIMKYCSVVSAFLFCIGVMNVKSAGTEKGQQKMLSIAGVVRDAHTKLPITAAQITDYKKSVSATTDKNGVFRIKISSAKEVVFVSAFDYGSREVPVQGKDSVVIDLYPDAFGSYYKEVEGLTGSNYNSFQVPASKQASDFSQSTAISVDDLLQTELGGSVKATSRSGLTGIGASAFIRGINSLNANAQPLYIVDGIIWNNYYSDGSLFDGYYSNPLDNIDVNDVESVSVLKDGTSIYGSKAANGVILIKTKRGKSTVTKINLNIMTGITDQPKTIPVMNADQYREYVSDILGTTGLDNNTISSLPYLLEDPSKPIYNTYHNNTNWNDQVYRQGATNSYSISANGGDEKALYYFSLGYTGNTGVVKSTDFERMNARFNADVNVFKGMKLGLNIGFTHISRTLLDDGVNDYTSSTWLSRIKSPFLSPNTFTSLGKQTIDYDDSDIFGLGNPSAIIANSNNALKQFRFNLGVTPTFNFSPNLSLSSQFDFSLYKNNEEYFIHSTGIPTRYLDGIGNVENFRYSLMVHDVAVFDETKLTYQNKFDGFHNLKAILGCRYTGSNYESDLAGGYNNDKVPLSNSYEHLNVTGANNLVHTVSNYVNLEYNYDRRYLLTGVASMDGSSRFGSDVKGGFDFLGQSWGLFPSINAAWLMSSEKFMKHIEFLNFCKIRAGYGLTGNDDIEDYRTRTYFSSIRYMDRANGLILRNIANPGLQWETTRKANLGVDMGLFNDRVSLSFDLFSNVTDNMLNLRTYPDVTGLGTYWGNGGKMSNKGYELSLDVKALNLKNLTWELGLNVGHYKNEILALPEGDYTTSVYGGEVLTAVGHPVGTFYGYKTDGVFATQQQAAAANLKTQDQSGTYRSFTAGDIHFVDVNKDGMIDAKDKQVIGNPNPDVYGTVSSKLTYRRLTLNTLFTYSFGNDIYNYQRSQLESGSNFYNQSTTMLSRWTGDGQHTLQPKAVYDDPEGNARFSDRWIEDGSYFRLKTVSLSYNVPLKVKFLDGLTIWASANNLLTFTKYLGSDPEFSARNSVYYQGIDNGLVPQSKSYYLGVKINL
ncbi:MAG: SusC/RagA family TonB-linked outer membrane protein, partial [Bacteroidota bacterium]|nr:SusC/RagA family TonB-linked outer membrane protein [Bacteroidota bacterium]